MADLSNDPTAEAIALLIHYSFDLGGHKANALVDHWSRYYPDQWLRLAVLEALYQGRYKAISVDQILSLWQRRQQPVCHFNSEFERIVCNDFPADFRVDPESLRSIAKVQDPEPAPEADPAVGAAEAVPPASATVDDSSERTARGDAAPEGSPADKESPAFSKEETQREEKPRSSLPSALDAALQQTSGLSDDLKPDTLPQPDWLKQTGWVSYRWKRQDVAKNPIDQFTPVADVPEFYDKLKAVNSPVRKNDNNVEPIAIASESTLAEAGLSEPKVTSSTVEEAIEDSHP